MSNEMTTTHAPSDFDAILDLSSGEKWKACQMLARSPLVPKDYAGKPESVAIAGAMGARLGLDLFAAIQSIAVVNGRPTIWGDARLGVCQRHPDWRGMVVTWSPDRTAVDVAVSRREGSADVIGTYRGHFSVAAAKTAGLLGKSGPWSQYPERMMELRARGFALRAAFADALMGMLDREEVDPEAERPAVRVYEMRPSATVVVSDSPATPDAATVSAGATDAQPAVETAPTEPRDVLVATFSAARGRGVPKDQCLSALTDLLQHAVSTSADVADAEIERAIACLESL